MSTKIQPIGYRDRRVLDHFITAQGKIRAKRLTKVSTKQHRAITKAIKKSRILARLPFMLSGILERKIYAEELKVVSSSLATEPRDYFRSPDPEGGHGAKQLGLRPKIARTLREGTGQTTEAEPKGPSVVAGSIDSNSEAEQDSGTAGAALVSKKQSLNPTDNRSAAKAASAAPPGGKLKGIYTWNSVEQPAISRAASAALPAKLEVNQVSGQLPNYTQGTYPVTKINVEIPSVKRKITRRTRIRTFAQVRVGLREDIRAQYIRINKNLKKGRRPAGYGRLQQR